MCIKTTISPAAVNHHQQAPYEVTILNFTEMFHLLIQFMIYLMNAMYCSTVFDVDEMFLPIQQSLTSCNKKLSNPRKTNNQHHQASNNDEVNLPFDRLTKSVSSLLSPINSRQKRQASFSNLFSNHQAYPNLVLLNSHYEEMLMEMNQKPEEDKEPKLLSFPIIRDTTLHQQPTSLNQIPTLSTTSNSTYSSPMIVISTDDVEESDSDEVVLVSPPSSHNNSSTNLLLLPSVKRRLSIVQPLSIPSISLSPSSPTTLLNPDDTVQPLSTNRKRKNSFTILGLNNNCWSSCPSMPSFLPVKQTK